MSWFDRAWRLLRPPLIYVSVALGAILGVTALGMATRGLLIEWPIPPAEVLGWVVGAVALLGLGLGLRFRGAG